MTTQKKIIEHKIWGNISIEKIPDFRIIEKNINHMNYLSRKKNIHLFEKLNINNSNDFMHQLEEVISINNGNNKKLISYEDNKKINRSNSKKCINKDQKNKIILNNKYKNNKPDETKNDSKLMQNINYQSTNEYDDSSIQEKDEKKNYAFLNNHNYASPLKGNFSMSLKYYNNQEFLLFLNKRLNKDHDKMNLIFNNSKKINELKEEFYKENQKENFQKIKYKKESNDNIQLNNYYSYRDNRILKLDSDDKGIFLSLFN